MSPRKPYLGGEREYLETYSDVSWEDADPSELSPYSELQKPYQDDRDEYPEWEWQWPPPWPFVSLPGYGWPDPEPDPCSVEADCTWAKLIGVDKMQCGDCETFTPLYVTLSCGLPPWYFALVLFELDTVHEDCYIERQNLINMTVCCEDAAKSQEIVARFRGAMSCTAEVVIEVDCDECCDAFTITGNATQNPGTVWVGEIDPPCRDATCEVVTNGTCPFNSTCRISDDGKTVWVYLDADDCGTAMLTVTGPTEDNEGVACDPLEEAVFGIRINDDGQGGEWVDLENSEDHKFFTPWS